MSTTSTSAPLIVLEGLDGVGKTTQARLLAARFGASGRDTHLTREPSDGPIGRLIREILTGQHAIPDQHIDPSTFSLLFAADRMDHLQREVEPKLSAGTTVVCDRWYHTSLAYRGAGGARDWIAQLNVRARRPDLTIFLQVSPEVAELRRIASGRPQELFENREMQQKATEGYHAVIAELRSRGELIVTIDGEQPPDDVSRDVFRVALGVTDKVVSV